MNPSYASILGSERRRRKRRWPRILLWTFAGLLALLLLAVAAGVLWLRSAEKTALPMIDGELHINNSSEAGLSADGAEAGLSAPVTVRRDDHGVPHIEAATQDDLFVAQGYVTAQDRLWQMDALRRNANGELAEVLGRSLVPHDKMQRVLQMRASAQRIYSNLDAANRARLDDYARGVNLFIAEHQDSLPAEFRLLHYRPQPWSGADSISIGAIMMSETLDDHWDVKLAREEISAKLHNPKLEADLYPVGSWREHPPTGVLVDLSQPRPQPAGKKDSDDDDDDRSQAGVSLPWKDVERGSRFPTHFAEFAKWMGHGELLGMQTCTGCIPGSNNWVIAGTHTASGKPLLSNDMHLDISVPNIWYMADLSAPGIHVEGVTIPGVPFVIAGHNEHVAWGYTALYADVQDLYLEKLDGKGNYYQAPDGTAAGVWKPLTVNQEVIHVRGGKDVVVEVQSTAHGPLLNPLFGREIHPFSLKWTIYDPTLSGLPIYQLDVASSCAEATAALSSWRWPTLNVVYSDDQGHIAYHAVGSVPVRPAGLQGVPIQDGAHEWQGYIPFDQMPNSLDPPSGFLATANSRVTTDASPYPLTLEWADPYRIQRIYKVLQGRDKLTPKDMLAVQTDVYSEVDQEIGHRLAYAIDHTPGVDDRLRKAADLMRSWDGRLTTESVAASIVTQARHAFWPLILAPKLGKDAGDYSWSDSNFAEEEIIMHGSPDWLPPAYKNWDALLTDAVRKGMENGKAPADVTKWKYGSWHVVDIEHPLAGFLPFISRIAGTGPQPLSGDTTTVKQVGREFGPSQRFTLDWSDIDGSTENIVLGESGDPYSPYFRDQWSDWYSGTTFAFPFTPQAVAAQTRHTLRLLP
jgi:penicillin G amidase